MYPHLPLTLVCRQDLPTPCLLVDEDVVKQNCQDMLDKAAKAG